MKLLLLLFSSILIVTQSYAQCVPANQRIDCHPDNFHDGSSWESQCQARGCNWCDTDVENAPWCILPFNYGYRMVGNVEEFPYGWRVLLERVSLASYFGNDSQFIYLEATYQSDYRLRLRIYDRDVERWEVPMQVGEPGEPYFDPQYQVVITNGSVFSFRVERRATGTIIFDTGLGGLTFSDQFLQISTRFPSTNVYGIGEQEHSSFKHDFDKFPVWPMYARDQAPRGMANLYGTQPYYTVIENDGNAHSAAFINSNAQEVVMLPGPGMLYRTIGGVIDMYFFMGPTPNDVVQQSTRAFSRGPMVPYWALGFHLCRYGYNTLDNMRNTLQRNVDVGIPIDVLYGDIDIMDREMDFTIDPINFVGLNDYVLEIKGKGIKFMTILDPAIASNQPSGSYRAFDLGQEMDVWYKRPDGTPMVGRVWPGNQEWPVYFPDYSKKETEDWWITLIKEFVNPQMLAVDGMWIDMNEPANFEDGDWYQGCADNKWNNPPYVPQIESRFLSKMTLCGDHVGNKTIHYNDHSLYGWYQSEPTLRAMQEATNKRSFVLSRSTFIGSGRWVSHWLGDNWSNWTNLHTSVIGMLEFNLFGVPMVGADICGFIGDSNEQLCRRWMQLGAFYTFSRNHNAINNIDQDPFVWGEDVIESSKRALEVRYTLLPYLYTLFYHSHRYGDAVLRALWYNYPTDSITLNNDRQFFWGDGVMISPVLEQDALSVNAYFPNDPYYSYYDGALVGTRGGSTQLDAPKNFINVHIRGGKVLPTQEPGNNTETSRNNPFGFIIALDDNGNASGDLYFDDGDSQNPVQNNIFFYGTYSVTSRTFRSTVVNNGYSGMGSKTIGTVRIFGANSNGVLVDGIPHSEYTNLDNNVMFIYNLNLTANVPFTITF